MKYPTGPGTGKHNPYRSDEPVSLKRTGNMPYEPVRERERVSKCECECECRCVCVVQLGLSERDVVAALKETPQRESSPPGHVSQSGQCFIFGALYPSKSGLPGTGIRSGNTQAYRDS